MYYMLVSKNLYYTENHLWFRKIGLHDFCMGITDYAQKEIGEIHLIEFTMLKNLIGKNDSFGVVHGINMSFELIAPCSCKIMETNQNLNLKPSHINIDPYGCWFLIFSTHHSMNEFLTHKQYIQITQ